MNVYDWDKTIYNGDSTFDFMKYLWWHRPKTWLNLPRTLIYGVLYKLGIVEKQVFKENLFRAFMYVNDMKEMTSSFVTSHLDKVKRWYVEQRAPRDIIITASPEFLVETFGVYMRSLRMAERRLIVVGSPVDMYTGKYSGKNCDGEEKVRIFKLRWANRKIDEFYSDSLSDTPMARLAERAFLVKGTKIKNWPDTAVDIRAT